jgi:hypothetical protein
VARTQSRCPPGPSNRAYLSLHLSEVPQGWSPFAPVLHLQQHELGRNLHLRTKPRVSPTPVVNHSSLRSGHPSTTGTLLVLTLRWHKNLWFILLTSSTLFYVRLTLLHNQTSWATCLICVLFHITGIVRVDGVIHSTDPIFASGYELWCCHVSHTCAFCMLIMRGKDTLHSNGGCPRLDAVHVSAWRMDTVSISER